MRILVTGTGGFLGRAVAVLAVERGHNVVGLQRSMPPMTDRFYETVALDLHDSSSLAEALARYRPEAIVHAAWGRVSSRHKLTSVPSLADVSATLTLAELGIRHGLERFVGVGSQAEYGAIDGLTDESRPLAPSGWYGSAKVAAFFLAQQQCIENAVSFAWARLFSVYGPDDGPNWLIPSVLAELCAGRRPRMTSGRQLWDYLYIDDAAAALLALCEHKGASGAFNLGSGRATSVRSVIERIRDEAAPGLELVFGEVPHGAAQIWHMEADTTKLRTQTGWAPMIDLETGLARTVDAYRRKLQRGV